MHAQKNMALKTAGSMIQNKKALPVGEQAGHDAPYKAKITDITNPHPALDPKANGTATVTAGFLARVSSYLPRLPICLGKQWLVQLSSSLTVAGPQRICTAFPF
jgi:hypothetical protein